MRSFAKFLEARIQLRVHHHDFGIVVENAGGAITLLRVVESPRGQRVDVDFVAGNLPVHFFGRDVVRDQVCTQWSKPSGTNSSGSLADCGASGMKRWKSRQLRIVHGTSGAMEIASTSAPAQKSRVRAPGCRHIRHSKIQPKGDQQNAAIGSQQDAARNGDSAPYPCRPRILPVIDRPEAGNRRIQSCGNEEDAECFRQRRDRVVRGERADRSQQKGPPRSPVGHSSAGQIGDEEAGRDIDDDLHQQNRVVVLATEQGKTGGEECRVAGKPYPGRPDAGSCVRP